MVDKFQKNLETHNVGDDGELVAAQPVPLFRSKNYHPFRFIWWIWLILIVSLFAISVNGNTTQNILWPLFVASILSQLFLGALIAASGVPYSDTSKKKKSILRAIPEEIAPSLFIIHDSNERYLIGKTAYSQASIWYGILGIICLLGLAAIWIILLAFDYTVLQKSLNNVEALLMEPIVAWIITSLLAFCPVGLTAFGIKNMRQDEYIYTNGELLFGTIETHQKYRSKGSVYHSIQYRFVTSAGKVRFGTEDISGKESALFPPVGTPVAILYVNKKRFKVM